VKNKAARPGRRLATRAAPIRAGCGGNICRDIYNFVATSTKTCSGRALGSGLAEFLMVFLAKFLENTNTDSYRF
jgi:hypothetical protein